MSEHFELLGLLAVYVAAVATVLLVDELRGSVIRAKMRRIDADMSADFAAENILEAFDVRLKGKEGTGAQTRRELALLLRQDLFRHKRHSLKSAWWSMTGAEKNFPS